MRIIYQHDVAVFHVEQLWKHLVVATTFMPTINHANYYLCQHPGLFLHSPVLFLVLDYTFFVIRLTSVVTFSVEVSGLLDASFRPSDWNERQPRLS